jgi:hypothetical protein
VANDVRQTDIHTVEPLVTDAYSFEAEIAVEKLKIYKSSGRDQFSSELIRGRG